MPKYHIFDLDGTLVDSMPIWSGAMLKILDDDGVSYPSDLIKIITPLGYHGTAKYFFELGAKATSLEELEKRMNQIAYERYASDITTKNGVKEYLQKLKNEGKKLCVLTASPHRMTDTCLQRNGIFEWFDKVWSTDDFTYNKADVRIYEEVCKKLQCEPKDVCFYDDNLTNIQTAKRAGIKTVGIYDLSSADYSSEIRETADEYYDSFEEL